MNLQIVFDHGSISLIVKSQSKLILHTAVHSNIKCFSNFENESEKHCANHSFEFTSCKKYSKLKLFVNNKHFSKVNVLIVVISFTITAEILARSLTNFHCQFSLSISGQTHQCIIYAMRQRARGAI